MHSGQCKGPVIELSCMHGDYEMLHPGELTMSDIRITIDASDYLVLATVLRRRSAERLPADRDAVRSEITQFIDLIEPVVSRDNYFHTHTTLARRLLSADDPMSALDHIDALLVRCGALRTQPPRLLFMATASPK